MRQSPIKHGAPELLADFQKEETARIDVTCGTPVSCISSIIFTTVLMTQRLRVLGKQVQWSITLFGCEEAMPTSEIDGAFDSFAHDTIDCLSQLSATLGHPFL